MLTQNEIIRYKRQLPIKGWGIEAQEKLKASVVTVAGAGGIGGPVVMYLAGAGVGTIRVCDFDTVELSNLNRQILHKDKSTGMNKALSATMTASDFNPDIKLVPIEEKLTTENADRLLAGSSLIMDCLDNFETRQLINRYAAENSVPLVHGGITEFHGQVTFIHTPETPCLACFLPSKNVAAPPNVIGASAGLTGSLQAMEALKYLTGIGENIKNKLLFWDALTMDFSLMSIPPNPDCPVCGRLHKNKK